MTIPRNLSILATNVSAAGVLTAVTGGTGLSSVGTTGNVLTSNGTIWVSSALVVPSGSLTFTGDATGTGTTGSSTALTLATVNSNTGIFGSTTAIPVVTVNAKGLVTAVSTASITVPSGSLTFTGDATGTGTTGSSTALTLATVNSNTGIFGSTTAIPIVTVNAKGLVTAVSTASITVPSGSLTFTGDATGTGTTGSSTALTLADTAVTAGSYTTANITVDSKGRITAASNGTGGSSGSTVGATTSSVNKLSSVVSVAGTNTYTVAYTIGYADVFVNGVKLNPADITATNGTTVVVPSLVIGDEVEVIGTTQVAVSATATYKRTTAIATAEQTVFTAVYTTGYIEVFYNGILLDPGDYTATNGTSVTLTTPATLGDTIETIAYAVAAVNPSIVLTPEWGGTGLSAVGTTGNVLTSNGTIWVSSPLVVPSGSLTFTGDATGTGTTGSSTALTLANTAVTAGSYTTANITVDAKGRITAATSGVAASVASEKINKTIDAQVAYIVTGTLATAATMPTTAGFKYIVHSIYVTNVDSAFGATTTVNANIAFSGGATVVAANKVPVPARGSIELLKKPQVLNPGDIINLQSLVAGTGTGSVLQAIITYETVATSLSYFGVGLTAPDTVTDMYVSTGVSSVVDSIRLVNNSDLGNIAVTLSWTDAAGTLQAYLTSNFIIPSNATVEICESSKRIPSGHKLRALATTANAISVFISGRTQ